MMLGYLGCSTWSKDVECHSMLPLLVQGSAGFSQMSYWTIQKLLRTTGGAACTCITVPMMLTVCANCFFMILGPANTRIYVNVLDVKSGVLYSGARVCAGFGR